MICSKCKKNKDACEFRLNRNNKTGYQSNCIDCDKEYQKSYYERNRQKAIDKSKKYNRVTNSKLRDYIVEYLNSHPCNKCGEKDIVVLEFDHQRDKKYNISHLLKNGSIRKLKEEIEKCQVLCANCHRRKTANDFKWYKNTI